MPLAIILGYPLYQEADVKLNKQSEKVIMETVKVRFIMPRQKKDIAEKLYFSKRLTGFVFFGNKYLLTFVDKNTMM